MYFFQCKDSSNPLLGLLVAIQGKAINLNKEVSSPHENNAQREF